MDALNRIKLLILSILFVFSATICWADTHEVTSCTRVNVQNAVNAASDGDEVFLNCASGTWSDTYVTVVGKGITIRGNGKDSTVIDGGLLIDLDCASNSLMRITGIHFSGNTGVAPYGSTIMFNYCANAGCTPMKGRCETYGKLRIDNNRFTIPASWSHVLYSLNAFGEGYPMGGNVYGLVDNNEFIKSSGEGYFINIMGDNNWGRDADFGTWKALYVESNTFTSQAYQGNSSTVDVYVGEKIVTRFNTIYTPRIIMHGADTVPGSVQTFEIYRNSCIANIGLTYGGIGIRGGTGFVFDNPFTITGDGSFDGNPVINLQYYRAQEGYGGTYGECGSIEANGTWFSDNHDIPAGWRCLQQNGVLWDTATTKWKTVPTYVWNNTYSGSEINPSIPYGGSTIVVNDREYYKYNASCVGGGSCTSGVGKGTSFPTTCTQGTGFWRNDLGSWNQSGSGEQGLFYQCGASNNWVLYYTPYTYPHPLRGDLTAPVMSSPLPSGWQKCTSNPRAITLGITTNENTTCKYDTSDVAYDSMSGTFTNVPSQTVHTVPIIVNCGVSYTYYVRCVDGAGNKNTSSTEISFSIDKQTVFHP